MPSKPTEKLCFIDCETSGLSPHKNAILQLSGCIEVDGVVKDTFNFFMRPWRGAVLDSKALAINGITEDQLAAAPEAYVCYAQLTQLLNRYVDCYNKFDKLWFVAYNSGFDEEFVREFFKKHGSSFYGSYFWVPSICVMKMAALRCLGTRGTLPNFKLGTVAAHFGCEVEAEKLHDAMTDINLTRELFWKVRGKEET